MPGQPQLDLFHIPDEPYIVQKFKIYRSSAGSGKTFALAKDYLKIVIRNPDDFKHILAITFTNKATTEMKERILANLQSIARGEESDMRSLIEKELLDVGIDIKDVISKRASTALSNILNNYSQFEISTIDYFFTRVVRALAKEIDMPMRYDLDVDNEKAMMEAIKKTYEELDTNSDLRRWLEEFSFNRIEDNKGWKIDRNILDLGMELFKETFHTGLERIRETQGQDEIEIDISKLRAFVGQLYATISTMRSTLRGICEDVVEVIESSPLDLKSFKANTANFFYTRRNADDLEPTATLRTTTDSIDNWFTKKGIGVKAQLSMESQDLLVRKALQYVEYYDKHLQSYQSAIELKKNIYSYGLLAILNQKLAEYKKENNLMLLSDTNLILRNVIREKDAPFLYEKMGGRYKFILIDEFQDTSRFQWKNLLPLVINSISNNHQGLIVGDVKQAIYRWRGGDFKLLMEEVNQDLEGYREHLEDEVLPSNWRSLQNVVEFNNVFFDSTQLFLDGNPSFPEGKHYVANAYKNASQKVEEGAGGYVRIQFFEGYYTWKEDAKESTLTLVRDLQQQGYTLSDILILTDTNDLASEVAQVLTENKVRVVTEQSLNISSSRVVNLFINIFYWMANPSDRNAMASIVYIYSLVKGLPLNHEKQEGSQEAVQRVFPDGVTNEIPYLKAKPVHELTEELILRLGLQDQVDIFLQRFMDICLEQAIVGNHDITSFLHWWEDAISRREKQRELSVVMPANSEAVQVMTIHKAKGLEKPVVIIPFASYSLSPRGTFWTTKLGRYDEYGILPLNFSKDLANSHFTEAYSQEFMEGTLERLNQTYVAFTRPKERLYVFAEEPRNKSLDKGYEEVKHLLWNTLSDPAFPLHNYWDASRGLFEMGEAMASKEDSEPGHQPEMIDRYSANPFSDKIVLREDSRRFFTLLDGEKSAKIREGILAHAALELISEQKDIPVVLRDLVDQGLAGEELVEPTTQLLEQLFKIPEFANWFDPKWEVFSERSLFLNGREYRPDRFITKDNDAIIIDYKREKEGSGYQKQVNEYAELIQSMGYNVVGKYLVYIQSSTIEPV